MSKCTNKGFRVHRPPKYNSVWFVMSAMAKCKVWKLPEAPETSKKLLQVTLWPDKLRNPDGEAGVWCYTGHGKDKWRNIYGQGLPDPGVTLNGTYYAHELCPVPVCTTQSSTDSRSTSVVTVHGKGLFLQCPPLP